MEAAERDTFAVHLVLFLDHCLKNYGCLDHVMVRVFVFHHDRFDRRLALCSLLRFNVVKEKHLWLRWRHEAKEKKKNPPLSQRHFGD